MSWNDAMSSSWSGCWPRRRSLPRLTEGRLSRLEEFARPFTAALAEPEQRRHTVEYLTGCSPSSNIRRPRGSPISTTRNARGSRSSSAMSPGVTAAPHDARPPGRHRPGRGRRRHRLRPLGLRREGDKSRWRGPAVVRPARQGRELPGGRLHGLRFAKRTCDRQHAPLSPRGMGEGPGRCKAAGVPKEVKFRTRHELALEMLDEHGPLRPIRGWLATTRWAAPLGFRRDLQGPANATCWRSPRTRWSATSRCRRRILGAAGIPESVRAAGSLARGAAGRRWTGDRGPRRREGAAGGRGREAAGAGADARRAARGRRSCCSSPASVKRTGRSSMITICRTPPRRRRSRELARVSKAAHRIEECFKRAKGEAGLADYQVRTWVAWHHHQTLSLLAAWFLNQETRRGKNPDPGVDVSAVAAVDRRSDRGASWFQRSSPEPSPEHALAPPRRVREALPSPIA